MENQWEQYKHHPSFQEQKETLLRLKTSWQLCLILGIVFSVIGLISKCSREPVVTAEQLAPKTEQVGPTSMALDSQNK